MSSSPQDAGPGRQTGEVAGEVACRKCSYNLNGLLTTGRCPECGTPIGVSVQGDYLRYADPAWLETMAKGLRIILWGVLVNIIANAAGRGIAAGMGPSGEVLAAMLSVGAAVFGLWGAYLLTEPDPSGAGENQGWNVRRFVRVTLLIALIGALLAAPQHLLSPTPLLTLIIGIASGLANLVGVAGDFAKFLFLERLAMRIPAPDLAKQCRTVRWGYTICLGSMIVLGLFTALAAALAGPAAVLLGCVIVVPGVGFIVFAIMSLVAQYRLAKAFSEQAHFARALWAQFGADSSAAG